MHDQEHHANTLADEFGATKHSKQTGAYMPDGLPFYAPRLAGDHISILRSNNVPLPGSLIEALVNSPELLPDDVLIRWTQEQHLLIEATLGQLRHLSAVASCSGRDSNSQMWAY